jgi:hypothetical protein
LDSKALLYGEYLPDEPAIIEHDMGRRVPGLQVGAGWVLVFHESAMALLMADLKSRIEDEGAYRAESAMGMALLGTITNLDEFPASTRAAKEQMGCRGAGRRTGSLRYKLAAERRSTLNAHHTNY